MKIIFAMVLLHFISSVSAQGRVAVSITNLENSKGVCKTCLFSNAASFSGNGAAYKCVELQIQNGKANTVFDQLPQGQYAIAVFHDQNRNNKMDKNFLGIPKEGYGASKNKLPFASAPTFKDNQFEVGLNTSSSINIRIRNL